MACFAAGCLVSGSFAALAQDAPAPVSVGASQPPVTTLRVFSRETVVDVIVTDDKGKPVLGLEKSDFTVKEDDQPQPIRSLVEVSGSVPQTPQVLPPNTWSNSTTLPATGPVQVFLFDVLGSKPADIVGSKKYIADYFKTMPKGTQVALFEISPTKGLRLLQGFTSDGGLAAAAVNNIDAEWLRTPVHQGPVAIASMNHIAAYVAGVHGRKNLVWITSRTPLLITRDGGLAWGTGESADSTRVHQLMDLYDIFTQEQIAIYPLDPGGVKGIGTGELKREEIAAGTGGTTAISNDFKGTIAKIVENTAHFYTLSYVPPRPDSDGHFHPIDIKVDRPNVHLSYRTGYNDEKPGPLDDALKAAMIQGPMRLGAMPATQLIFTVNVEPSGAAKAGNEPATPVPAGPKTKGLPYNVVFQLDPTQLTPKEGAESKRTYTIELDLGAFDSYSQLTASRNQTLEITLSPAQYAAFIRKPFKFTLPIDLPKGKLNLRAGIFDTVASKAGTIEAAITVEKR